MSSVVMAFPQNRNVGKARHVAQKLLSKSTQRDRDAYWRRVVSDYVRVMQRIGIPDSAIQREIDGLHALVSWQIAEMHRRGPGAA